MLGEALGYDPNPGIVLVVRAPGGGRLDLRDPRVRGDVDRLAASVAGVDGVGRVVNPLHDRRAGAELIATDGRSLVLLVDLSSGDLEDRGGIVAEDVEPVAAASALEVSMGGYAPSFNEVNDQTKTDLTKAELIAFPILALLLLLVFRGVVAAGIPLLIGGISIVGTLFVLRVMSLFVDTSIFALNIATALSLGLAVDYALLMVSQIPGGDRARRRHPRGAPAHRGHRRAAPPSSRGSPSPAALAALAILPQRFLYSMAVAGASVGLLSAIVAILVVPSMLALLGTRIDALSIRRGAVGLGTSPTAGTGSRAASCGIRSASPSPARPSCWPPPRR